MASRLALISMLASTALAAVPSMSNYRLVWSDDFGGSAGNFENGNNWGRRITTSPSQNYNGELQFYTDRTSTAHTTGNGELNIVPIRGGSGTSSSPYYYSSARLESRGAWMAPAGKAMVIQAEIRLPDFSNDNTQGLWPAFWTLGNACRNGVDHPECGEWDILEVAHHLGGQNQANLHFGGSNGQYWGRTSYSANAYHTWGIKIDRRNSDWKQQSITFWRDGNEYFRVLGSRVNNKGYWDRLTAQPYYIVLNVAVGGGFGGAPQPGTIFGDSAAMRVRYVGVYESV